MKNLVSSLKGVITLSVISLLVFLGRTFLDFYYVFDEFALDIGTIGLMIVVNMALFGGWIGGLLSAVQGSRRGLMTIFGFNLFFSVVIAIGTLVSFCPSPCQTGWPLAEIFIWLSLVFGMLATIVSGIQVYKDK
ncbi:MAG: hypothetical protein HQ525_03195 [Anaerolineae bacterium]|nr:hypothetical protein [Anaerolineae bacterium]